MTSFKDIKLILVFLEYFYIIFSILFIPIGYLLYISSDFIFLFFPLIGLSTPLTMTIIMRIIMLTMPFYPILFYGIFYFIRKHLKQRALK